MLDVKAQTIDWWPALRVTVPTQYSCAYNLWNTYYNQDIFYVRGDGYSWAWKGHLTGSERGKVDIQIQAGQLSAGTYPYLLIGDGKASEAKMMIITK